MAEIVMRKLGELRKYPRNPRNISASSFEALKDSILRNRDYFESNPLKLSDRTGKLVIIGGNMRFEACKALGIKEVPTVLIEGLTEEREKELVIIDNVTNGDWDYDLLANDWNEDDLKVWGVDVPTFEMTDMEADEEAITKGEKEPDTAKCPGCGLVFNV